MNKKNSNRSYDPFVLDKLHRVQVQILNDFIQVCEKYDLKYFVLYGTAIGTVRHNGFIPWDDDIDVGMLREDYNKFLEIFPKEMKEHYYLLTPETDERYACTVTHIQRKGTIFVSEVSKNLTCEQCIFMDIFPFDYVAKGKVASQIQGLGANIWGKLLFLVGSGDVIISVEGIPGRILEGMCKVVHRLLKVLRIKSITIYKQFQRTATYYNDRKNKSEYVTSFEYMGCLKDKIKASDIFPLEKGKFEGIDVNVMKNNHELLTKVYGNYMKIPEKKYQINHMPLMIKFEDDDKIYR